MPPAAPPIPSIDPIIAEARRYVVVRTPTEPRLKRAPVPVDGRAAASLSNVEVHEIRRPGPTPTNRAAVSLRMSDENR